MSRFTAVRTMFVGNSVAPKATVVVRKADKPVLTAAQLQAELDKARAENAALKASKAQAQPKAKPVTPVTVSFQNVNGTPCVVLEGSFKPLYISASKWNHICDNAEVISQLFTSNR